MQTHGKRKAGILRRTASAMLMAALVLAAYGAHATKPMPPVQLAIAVDEDQLTVGEIARVQLAIEPEIDLDNARVEFVVGLGDLEITGDKARMLGALRAGETYEAKTSIRITAQGKGELRAYLYGLNSQGAELFWRSKALLVAASGKEAAAGVAGFIPLEVEVVKRRAEAGALAKSALDIELRRIRAGGAAEKKTVETGGKQTDITIQGTVLWTDSAGNTHPARFVDVEIRDENVAGSELVTTLTAGVDGGYYTVVNNSDTFGTDGRDIFVRVCANSTYANVVETGALGDTHCIESSTTDDVPDGSTLTIDLTANNTDDNNRAFSVHDALVTITQYTSSLTGSLPKIDTNFPVGGSVSFYDGTDLNILRDDWIDWDVIHHEYGHYFMDYWDIEDNPGGSHNLWDNLSESRGSKSTGVRLAWGEGFPTYFGTVGQLRQGASALGVPNVGDTGYTDTIDAAISYDLEANGPPTGPGEDNEASVQRILFDLYDSAGDGHDEVVLGDYTVYNTARNANAETLSEFWNQLISSATMQQTVSYGCIFMDHNVSPEPKAPADGAEFAGGDPPPDFDWHKRVAGPAYRGDEFTVQFWDEDFSSMIFESPEVNAPPWTPSASDWSTILGGADVVKWVVLGTNTSAPETGAYISCSRSVGGVDVAFVIDDTGSMGEEIGGVKSALTSFISTLMTEGKSVKINLITFKDNVTSRIISDDLAAVQAEVDGLFASGGGGCPEASVEGLNLAAQHVKAGGRVLFATDADPHPGLNLPGTIAALRAKGIRVDVILTASCYESFKRGTYLRDSTGKAYAIPPHCNYADCAEEIDPVKTPPGCDGPDCDTPIEPPAEYPEGAIAVFSALAMETGGVFAFVPEVNAGDTERFDNTVLNIMLGTVFPSIPSVNPPRGNRGTTLNIVITGSNTNFNATSTLSFSGDGITVNSGGATSATTFQANITIAADADLTFRDVTITTTLGDASTEEAVGTGAFEVEDALLDPTIVGVFPSQAGLGETLDVTITGAETNFDATSVASFYPPSFREAGITVNSFTPSSLTEGVANITIDADNAALGYYNVDVTTGAETADETIPGPFLVTTTALGEAVPRLVSVAPSSSPAGDTLDVTVMGENTSFVDGVSVGAFSGDGITVNSTTVMSETEAQMNITIAPAATPGFRDVSVATGGEVAAILDGFEVGNRPPTADAGPDQSLDAPSVGGSVDVTLDGSGSTDADGSITAYTWSGSPDPDDVAMPMVTLTPGVYMFTLVVQDNLGANSPADTVTITVNDPPAADAGPDQTLTLANGAIDVALDASGSSDSDGTIASYTWTGSPDPDDTVSPVVTLDEGTYTFTLVVEDDAGASSAPDTVTIIVEAGGFQCFGGLTKPAGIPQPPAGDLAVLLLVAVTVLFASRRVRRRIA